MDTGKEYKMIFVLEINNGQSWEETQYPYMEWTMGVSLELDKLIELGILESESRSSTTFTIHAWKQLKTYPSSSMRFFKDKDGVWISTSPYVNKYLGR